MRTPWTFSSRPRERSGAIILGALALLALLAWLAGPLRFYLSEPPSFDAIATVSLFAGKPQRFDHWYLADQRRLTSQLRDSRRGSTRAALEAEVAALDAEISRLDSAPDFIHPRRGFRIYAPATTARLHVMSLAAEARRGILAGQGARALRGKNALFLIAGYQLFVTRPSRLARVAEAGRALSEISLPDEVFQNYRVYLLPYSMGPVSGAGGPGYSLIGAAPLAVEVVPEQVASTLTHEFGHHLSLSRMGGTYGEDPARWARYLKIRGLPGWRSSGDVRTDDWARSTEETLAEDVRVLLGGPKARVLSYDSANRDPRSSARMKKETVAFLRGLAAAPVRMVDKEPVPWSDSDSVAEAAKAWGHWSRWVAGLRTLRNAFLSLGVGILREGGF